MVKHTQTIRRQKPTNCLSVFDHFVGLALKGLKVQSPIQCSIRIDTVRYYVILVNVNVSEINPWTRTCPLRYNVRQRGSGLIWTSICPMLLSNIYLFQMDRRNTRKRREIVQSVQSSRCSKFIIKARERLQWRRFCVFLVNFEYNWTFFLYFYCWLSNR